MVILCINTIVTKDDLQRLVKKRLQWECYQTLFPRTLLAEVNQHEASKNDSDLDLEEDMDLIMQQCFDEVSKVTMFCFSTI